MVCNNNFECSTNQIEYKKNTVIFNIKVSSELKSKIISM